MDLSNILGRYSPTFAPQGLPPPPSPTSFIPVSSARRRRPSPSPSLFLSSTDGNATAEPTYQYRVIPQRRRRNPEYGQGPSAPSRPPVQDRNSLHFELPASYRTADATPLGFPSPLDTAPLNTTSLPAGHPPVHSVFAGARCPWRHTLENQQGHSSPTLSSTQYSPTSLQSHNQDIYSSHASHRSFSTNRDTGYQHPQQDSTYAEGFGHSTTVQQPASTLGGVGERQGDMMTNRKRDRRNSNTSASGRAGQSSKKIRAASPRFPGSSHSTAGSASSSQGTTTFPAPPPLSAERLSVDEVSSAPIAGPSRSSAMAPRAVEAIDLSEFDDDESNLASVLQKQREEAVASQSRYEERSGGTRLSSMQCTVCLDNVTDLTATSCGHAFCRGCLLNWLKQGERDQPRRSNCPACRKVLRRDINGANNKSFVTLEIMKKPRPTLGKRKAEDQITK